jgi:hypothetical protein
LALKTTTLGSDYAYSSVSLSAINNNKYGRLKLNTRTYLQLGKGTNWAPESKLALSGANHEELSNNKFTRTVGIINADKMSFGDEMSNFHMTGGLNLRGYTGYLAPESGANTNYGTSGASFTTEIDFSSYLPYSLRRQGFGSYIFGDAAIINTEEINRNNYNTAFTDIKADAGIGFTYTHRNWGPLETIKPLVIRLDFPLLLNQPLSEEDFFQMRWILGIGKTF